MMSDLGPTFDVLSTLLDESDAPGDALIVATAVLLYVEDRSGGEIDFEDGLAAIRVIHKQVLAKGFYEQQQETVH